MGVDELWINVRAVLVDEMQDHYGDEPVTLSISERNDLADSLADVMRANFEMTPRGRRWRH